ncbi:hypothetical protein Ddye_027746 [Dipteronia dyeriana]|uniref:F-box/LRR-repeat protein 15-like leucin rich repeat domain-containing protein n=1 Tax=Dipteronia dyeriana TaxID=168575 RepID=A0AAD9TQD1_9ROSI|nr:hypothetical protein Ddye_027746 [Dipteronia dyeriana]
MERLPSMVLNEEIVGRLDMETLCSIACLNRAFRFSVDSQAIPSISSLHLNTMSPDGQTLHHILGRCKSLTSLTLNCLRLLDHSLCHFLTPSIQQLNLWCCSLLSYQILASIGNNCPNLRVLVLELADKGSTDVFRSNLAIMLNRCFYLESLSLKIRGTEVDANSFQLIEFFLPKTITTLKLKPMLESDAFVLISRVGRNRLDTDILSVPTSPPYIPKFGLQSLSLVLDLISDELLVAITDYLPLLVELDLEDRTYKVPLPDRDLTNTGLQFLGSCRRLTALSLVRGRLKHQGTFKRVNDMGMFLLSEGCKGLESVRFCGFSKVSDAGFASVLHSCLKLKKIEVRNSLFLSDLAFHDLTGVVSCALVEVRLLSCRLITSETVEKLALCRSLEILDLGGCKSIADSCLSSITRLRKLTTLNLSGADITDSGLYVLGQGSLPITNLCLRGCKRVTDKGVTRLLCGGGTIGKRLITLDLGYMPGISDETILAVAAADIGIIDLCIRSCFYVTDSSVEALARKRSVQGMNKQLRRLDLCNCISLSAESLRWLKKPSFQGLHWLGICNTRLASHVDSTITEIHQERPWLTLCLDGCEIGCHDGWQFHKPEGH